MTRAIACPELEVALIDLDARKLTFTDGVSIEITDLFDFEGDRFAVGELPAAEVCRIVAGPLPTGQWFSCELIQTDRQTIDRAKLN